MSPITKVALAGAGGSLGKPILEHLIDAGFEVTVLTRENSDSTFPATAQVAKVDYTSEASLTAALQGQHALISTLSTDSIDVQETLIKAAIAARVHRIIPSEFGSDTSLEANKDLPVYVPKIAIAEMLTRGVQDTNGAVTYTLVLNNVFTDWAINWGFLLDAKNKKINLYDGGETEYSTTPLHAVAKGVVGVLHHPEETANRTVRIHGTVLTQKQLLELGKKALGGEGWTVTERSTAQRMDEGWENFKNDPGDFMGWAFRFLENAIFSTKHSPKFNEVDNELLGVPDVGDEEIIEYIRKAASA